MKTFKNCFLKLLGRQSESSAGVTDSATDSKNYIGR